MKNVKAHRTILSRLLPKSGQTVSYADGDDGFYEAGWWRNKSITNNKVRFIAKTIDGDDVVIDRATGLVWAADGHEAGCNNGNTLNWLDAIAYANALTFAGHSDWRLPNVKELASIIDYGKDNPALDGTFFPNAGISHYFTSTTNPDYTTMAFVVYASIGQVAVTLKINSYRLRCVCGGL